MAEEFTAEELASLAAIQDELDNQGPLQCTCQHGHEQQTPDGVLKFCGNSAVVRAEIHMVHVCRHPDLVATKRVNDAGDTLMFLCGQCLEETRRFADAKVAQTRAKCTELSTVCQVCGSGLALHAPLQPGGYALLASCPNCGQERIHFEPICGAGVRDKEGNSYGCGAPLNSHVDVIRSVSWLDKETTK